MRSSKEFWYFIKVLEHQFRSYKESVEAMNRSKDRVIKLLELEIKRGKK